MKFVTVLALAATASSMPVRRQLADGLAGSAGLDGISGTASITDAPIDDPLSGLAQPGPLAGQPVWDPSVDSTGVAPIPAPFDDTLDDLVPPPDADDDDDDTFPAVPTFVKRHGPDGDDDEEPVVIGLDADVVVGVDPLDALVNVGASLGKRDDIDDTKITTITQGNIPIQSTAEYKEGEQGVVKRQEVTVITTTQGNIPITSSGTYKEGEQGALDTTPLTGSGAAPPPSNNNNPDDDDDDFPPPPPNTQVNNNQPPQQYNPPPPQQNNPPPPPPPQNNPVPPPQNNGGVTPYPRPGRGGGGPGQGGQGWGGGRGGGGEGRGGGGGRRGGPGGWSAPGRGGWNRPGNSPNQAGISIGVNLGGKDGLLGGRGGLLGDRGPLLGNNGLLGSNGLLGGILKRSPTTADIFGKRQTVDFAALSAAVASLGAQTGESATEGASPVNFPLSDNVEPQPIDAATA